MGIVSAARDTITIHCAGKADKIIGNHWKVFFPSSGENLFLGLAVRKIAGVWNCFAHCPKPRDNRFGMKLLPATFKHLKKVDDALFDVMHHVFSFCRLGLARAPMGRSVKFLPSFNSTCVAHNTDEDTPKNSLKERQMAGTRDFSEGEHA